MRYVPGLVCVLSMLLASPPSVGAQDGAEEGSAVERSQPDAYVGPTTPGSEPALQMGVNSTGLEVTPPPPPARRECKPRYMAGPAVGIAVGALAIVTGPALILAGTWDLELFGVESEKTRADRALQGSGAALLIAGFGALIYSSVKLAENRHKRERVCDKDYTLEELDLRKRRAAFGLIAPAAVTVAGVVPLALGWSSRCRDEFGFVGSQSCERFRTAGMVLTLSGGVGLIIGSAVVGARKRQQRDHQRKARLVQWDLETSRLVF